jgi:hypothetical protein
MQTGFLFRNTLLKVVSKSIYFFRALIPEENVRYWVSKIFSTPQIGSIMIHFKTNVVRFPSWHSVNGAYCKLSSPLEE